MFALELDRRLRAPARRVKSIAAHPGYAATNLQTAAPPLVDRLVMQCHQRLLAQSADLGALPDLYAATEPGLAGGSYAGPDGIGELRGHPQLVSPSRAARDQAVAKRLWEECESLTGGALRRSGAPGEPPELSGSVRARARSRCVPNSTAVDRAAARPRRGSAA